MTTTQQMYRQARALEARGEFAAAEVLWQKIDRADAAKTAAPTVSSVYDLPIFGWAWREDGSGLRS